VEKEKAKKEALMTRDIPTQSVIAWQSPPDETKPVVIMAAVSMAMLALAKQFAWANCALGKFKDRFSV
jgi:hypothetical protein